MIAHSGGSVYYASVGADSNGYWEATPTTDLVVDANNWVDLALIANDAGGNALSPWVGVQLTVLLKTSTGSALPPGSTPQITSATTVDSLRPLLTGKAAANAIVYVYLSGGSVLFGKPKADSNGDWQLQLSQDLYPESTSLAIAEFDANDTQVSGWSGVTLTVSKTQTSTALPPGSTPQITSSTTVDSLRPLLTGKAAANAIVYVYLSGGSVLFGKPKAHSNGDWQLQLSQDLYPESTSLAIAEFDANDTQVSGWSGVTLTVSKT
ncbi:hypothetical protein AOA59_03840 [Pseudomonas sp. 2822-15]|nr:hypothetical protein AOA59_03840 [Pseudomonas sp. 2822-15]